MENSERIRIQPCVSVRSYKILKAIAAVDQTSMSREIEKLILEYGNKLYPKLVQAVDHEDE